MGGFLSSPRSFLHPLSGLDSSIRTPTFCLWLLDDPNGSGDDNIADPETLNFLNASSLLSICAILVFTLGSILWQLEGDEGVEDGEAWIDMSSNGIGRESCFAMGWWSPLE